MWPDFGVHFDVVQEAIIVIVVVTVFGAPFAISLVIYCAYLMWWDPPTPWWTHRDLEAQQEWQSDPGSGNEQVSNSLLRFIEAL